MEELPALRSVTFETRGPRPLGNRSGLGVQSPRPALSARRGYSSPNQPSSMTKSFVPRAAELFARVYIVLSLKLKYTPSQLFSSTGRFSVANWLFMRCLR